MGRVISCFLVASIGFKIQERLSDKCRWLPTLVNQFHLCVCGAVITETLMLR